MMGENLKKIRKILKLKQSEFIKSLNISQTTLSQYENNKRKVPENIIKLLIEKYNINLNWLLTGEGKMFLMGEEDKENRDIEEIIRAIKNNEKLRFIVSELLKSDVETSILYTLLNIKGKETSKEDIEKYIRILKTALEA